MLKQCFTHYKYDGNVRELLLNGRSKCEDQDTFVSNVIYIKHFDLTPKKIKHNGELLDVYTFTLSISHNNVYLYVVCHNGVLSGIYYNNKTYSNRGTARRMSDTTLWTLLTVFYRAIRYYLLKGTQPYYAFQMEPALKVIKLLELLLDVTCVSGLKPNPHKKKTKPLEAYLPINTHVPKYDGLVERHVFELYKFYPIASLWNYSLEPLVIFHSPTNQFITHEFLSKQYIETQ